MSNLCEMDRTRVVETMKAVHAPSKVEGASRSTIKSQYQ
jgi:hypothetical protein